MIQIGLKLWSTNRNYLHDALDIFEKGYYQYIELFSVPDSYNETIKFWQNVTIPFVIHAPHYKQGLNFSNRNNINENIKLANEAQRFADRLSAQIIIFHPGVNGSIDETVHQLQNLHDNRVCIENKPYWGLDNELCIGHSPDEIEKIMKEAQTTFCLDIGHAINAANARKTDQLNYIKQFIQLKPIIYHLSDGDFLGMYDKHEHFTQGNFPLGMIAMLFPTKVNITIETRKDSLEHLDDFIRDSDYLNRLVLRSRGTEREWE